MSCQKLSRQSLHLVLNEGRGLFSLRHMDVSKLFYPSTAEALEAEARAKKKKKKNGTNKIGSIGRLPTPSIHYQPYTWSASNPYSSLCALALFGERSKNKILCTDMAGHTSVYNTELRSFMRMPDLNSPKRYNSCVAVSIPGASAHAMSNFDIDTDHSLYIMNIDPTYWCSSEVLAYDPVEECWCWGPLPQPPFFQDREYKIPLKPRFTVVDSTKICVSTTTATYSFDTATRDWNKVGDWVLPFKAEYVPELGHCLGISDGGPFDLCLLDNLSTAAGSSPPVVRHVGMEFELPENWSQVYRDLVNLGSLRFCIVNGYTIENELYECDFNPVTVFTGVELYECQQAVNRGSE
uniref:F-box associated domain-containing protein n=1 Tax=Oryza meridionalis TaxID=40149 RepID=A0A0E0D7N7_9ORYZ